MFTKNAAFPPQDTYQRNLERSGFGAKVTTLTGFSQSVLRTLPVASFDVIYIDGSHVKADVLEDAVLSWRLLKSGGLMIFDDYRFANYEAGLVLPAGGMRSYQIRSKA